MRYFFVVLVGLLLSACQVRPNEQPDAVYQRGVVKSLNGRFLFQPCQSHGWRILKSPPSILASEYRRQTHGEAALPVYVEGWGEQGADGWELTEPRMIGGDLATCEHWLSGVQLRAGGLDPVWTVDLTSHRLVFNDISHLQTLIFRRPDSSRDGRTWIWDGEIKEKSDSTRLELRVGPTPCYDKLGVWYALSAKVLADGDALQGCARYGDLERFLLFETYQTDPKRYLRHLTLLLAPEGAATLRDDYDNGQPVLVRHGSWQQLGDGNLLLSLKRSGDDAGDETLLFRRRADGSLALESDSPRYGKGLKLSPHGKVLQWPLARRRQLP